MSGIDVHDPSGRSRRRPRYVESSAVVRFGRKSREDDEATVPAPARESSAPPATTGEDSSSFLPARGRRRIVESVFVRVVATGGIVGIGTAIAAIMGSQDVAGWIIGAVVAGLSVVLAAILWSSRTL